MNVQQKAPKKVTVTPADPKYTQKDIRKQHLRVAPYCRVSTETILITILFGRDSGIFLASSYILN